MGHLIHSLIWVHHPLLSSLCLGQRVPSPIVNNSISTKYVRYSLQWFQCNLHLFNLYNLLQLLVDGHIRHVAGVHSGFGCCIPGSPSVQVLAHLSASVNKSCTAPQLTPVNSILNCNSYFNLFQSFQLHFCIHLFISLWLCISSNVATMYKDLLCLSRINYPVVLPSSPVCFPVPYSLCLPSLFRVLCWSCFFTSAVLATLANCTGTFVFQHHWQNQACMWTQFILINMLSQSQTHLFFLHWCPPVQTPMTQQTTP